MVQLNGKPRTLNGKLCELIRKNFPMNFPMLSCFVVGLLDRLLLDRELSFFVFNIHVPIQFSKYFFYTLAFYFFSIFLFLENFHFCCFGSGKNNLFI